MNLAGASALTSFREGLTDSMLWLAFKTLFHEKGRLVVTLVGITFSTVLVFSQAGMYIGMMGDATALVRSVDADIWVASKNIQNIDFSYPISEERINRVNALPEVLWSERLIMTWGFLKLADGGLEQVQVVGYNPDTMVGAPWSLIAGNAHDVKAGPYMILDKTAENRLGKLTVGSIWELSGKRVKLVGISDGIKSFTTSPMVFMSYRQAQMLPYGPVRSNQTSYIIAKLSNRETKDRVVAALRSSMKDNDIYTREDFIRKTIMYWTVQTGMGMGFFLTALLGLIVGGAIVGQTIYAGTMERLREFGTLKAIGATNKDIYIVIFSQAGINAAIGYAIGTFLIFFAKGGIEKAGVSIYLGAEMIFILFFVILLTCIAASFFSVRKIRTLDPVTVFKA